MSSALPDLSLVCSSGSYERPLTPLPLQSAAADENPLISAIATQNMGLIAYLLQAKADINAPFDEERTTPLIHAVKIRSPTNVISLLLNSGAKVNVSDTHHHDALYYAKISHNMPLCKQLRSAGAITFPVSFDPTIEVHTIDRHTDEDGELLPLAEDLLRTIQEPVKVIEYNPFILDLHTLLQKTTQFMKKPKRLGSSHLPPEQYMEQCFLKMMDKKYASVTETFTSEQMHDCLKQKFQLLNQAIKEIDYDYIEYDQAILDAALIDYLDHPIHDERTYSVMCFLPEGPVKEKVTAMQLRDCLKQQIQLHNQIIRISKCDYLTYDQDMLISVLKDYLEHPLLEPIPDARTYPIVRHRIPGFKNTNVTYDNLMWVVKQAFQTAPPTPRSLRDFSFQEPYETKHAPRALTSQEPYETKHATLALTSDDPPFIAKRTPAPLESKDDSEEDIGG